MRVCTTWNVTLTFYFEKKTVNDLTEKDLPLPAVEERSVSMVSFSKVL
jgi:hypothetical protein